MATDLAPYGRPTVPALDLSSAIAATRRVSPDPAHDGRRPRRRFRILTCPRALLAAVRESCTDHDGHRHRVEPGNERSTDRRSLRRPKEGHSGPANGAVVRLVNDGVMKQQRWVIIGMGLVVTVALAVAAVLFGLRGIEVASWLAGVASLVVAIAAVVIARSAPTPPAPPPGPAPAAEPRGPVTASGKGSVAAGGDIGGIASTGDDAINIQHR